MHVTLNTGKVNKLPTVLYDILCLEVKIVMRCKIFHVEDPIVAPSDILTRGGCNVTSKCSADANTVLWSPTRTGTRFVNTSTRATWVSVMGFYTCTFIGDLAF